MLPTPSRMHSEEDDHHHMPKPIDAQVPIGPDCRRPPKGKFEFFKFLEKGEFAVLLSHRDSGKVCKIKVETKRGKGSPENIQDGVEDVDKET